VIPEIGLAALWLAAALAALQLVAGALTVRGGDGAEIAMLTRPAAILQGGLTNTLSPSRAARALSAAKPLSGM
jgi:hypothetical protein